MKVLRFLWFNLENRKSFFVKIFVVSLLDGLFIYSVPYALSFLNVSDSERNIKAISAASILLLFSLITSYIIRRYGELLALTISEQVRIRMSRKILQVPTLTMQKYHSVYVLSLVGRVADSLPPITFNIYWWAARGIVLFTMFFILLFRESWVLVFLNMGLIILFVLASQYLSSLMLPKNKKVNEEKSKFMGVYADFLSNINTVKRMHIETFMHAKLQKGMETVLTSVTDQQKFHAFRWLILHALYSTMFVVTFLSFVAQFNSGFLNFGSFLVFVGLFWNMRGDLNMLAENLKTYTEVSGYIDQLDLVFADNLTNKKLALQTSQKKVVDIKNLSFRYPGTKTSIKVPKFDLNANEVVGIAGSSGEGKSTLLGIISGALPLQKGEINLGVRESQVVLMTQDVEILNLSLRDNLIFGQDISDDSIWEVLDELDLAKIAKVRTEGLDMVLGEKGLKLSAGQKQRLNIARAFLRNSKLLLLDEPVSHLDARNVDRVCRYIKNHKTDKSLIIVSHEKKLLSLADKVYEMKNHSLNPA
ncbi:MAG: ABC transporter ATP-binding protein [Patescibacteria group bacterium]